MTGERRVFRFSTLVSTSVSLVILGITAYMLATAAGVWPALSGAKQALVVSAFVGGLVLAASAFWHLASRSKRVGRVHGWLMAAATVVLFLAGYYSLPNRTSHEIVQAMQLLGTALWWLLGALAGVCSLMAVSGGLEAKKAPNQSSLPAPSGRG